MFNMVRSTEYRAQYHDSRAVHLCTGVIPFYTMTVPLCPLYRADGQRFKKRALVVAQRAIT